MRIVSRQRDYYDGVQAHDQDRSLTFVREERVVHYSAYARPDDKRYVREAYPLFTTTLNSQYNRYSGTTWTIGFCGKVYACLELRIGEFGPNEVNAFCYSVEDVDAFIDKNFPRHSDHYREPKGRSTRWWKQNVKGWQYGYQRHAYEAFFARHAPLNNVYGRFFEGGKSPIFVGCSGYGWVGRSNHGYSADNTITYNGLLGPLHFQKVFPPFQAYQELSMYLGNLAQPNPPMLKMSNEENASRLGHGDRYSFRRAPTKHIK
jgi:hypothetical protein